MHHSALFRAIRYGMISGLALGSPALTAEKATTAVEASSARSVTGDIFAIGAPVLVVQRRQLERTGLSSIGEILQELPIAGSALNTQFNGSGNGEVRIDLRSLGSRRVLVLLNGRRYVTSLAGSVDLNSIPLAAVQRIEIVKEGAAAIYGSQAITGVINIVTREQFEGVELDAQIGQFDGSGDGEAQSYSLSVGSGSDRGSLFFSASHVQQEPVDADMRLISAEPAFGTGNTFGSLATPQGRFGADFLGSFNLTTNPGANVTGPGGLGAAAFRPADSVDDLFNFAKDNYLLTPQERTSIYTGGHFDLTDAMRLRIEASWNRRESSQQLAPTPLFLGLFGSGLGGEIGVAAENPFNPFGRDLDPSSWVLARRLIEAGPRRFFQDVDSYRIGLAMDGAVNWLGRQIDWELGFVYGELSGQDTSTGLPNLQRVQNSLSAACVSGDILGCVPLNVFGGIPGNTNPRAGDAGSITPEMLDYILYTGQESADSTLRSYTADVSMPLLELPAGPLSLSAGYQYRREEGAYSPDALVASGNTSGSPPLPIGGSTSVDEVHVAMAIPLLADRRWARHLSLSVASRYSDHDTFGDTTNARIGIAWQPVDELLLRASWSEGYRAPSIAELYSGHQDTFPPISDPCADMLGLSGPRPAQPQAVIDSCIAQGVPADGRYNGVQINPVRVGGNPRLEPEKADTLTAGIVWRPAWVEGLDLSLDYFDIEVNQAVSMLSGQQVLDACTFQRRLCHLITRSASAWPRVESTTANISTLEVEGLDLLASYRPPATQYGQFRILWHSAYQSTRARSVPQLDSLDLDASVVTSLLGGSFGDTANPRWRSALNLRWNHGDWEAAWGIDYLHRQVETCALPVRFGFCNLDRDGDGDSESRRIGSTSYHDLQLSYHLDALDARFTLGVRNAFDKGPPLATNGEVSFNRADYRVPGRFPYLRLTVDL